jgi:ATP-dependent DNA helicase RecG
MGHFKAGKLSVLISTTVVEVGVDVPNATVMVIHHADRYGLSQLHQLRGRVGRGSKRSMCLLVADPKRESSRGRLSVMERTQDGFEVAEEDLRLRGPGELLGTEQHGFPEFRVANLAEDGEILQWVLEDAERLLKADERLESPEHRQLRAELLRRFRAVIPFVDVA